MSILAGRTGQREEESESAFVSMTDLVVSFLFILLVLLAFFATQVRPDDLFEPADTVRLDDYEALEREIARTREHLRIAQQQLADSVPTSEYEALERQTNTLRQTIASLREQLRVAEQRLADTVPLGDYKALEREVVRLRELLHIAEQRLVDAVPRREYETLEQQAHSLRETIASLREQLRIAEQRLAEAVPRSDHKALEREIVRLREQLRDRESDPLAVYLEGAAAARTALLNDLAGRIRDRLPKIRVTVVVGDGVIRFRGDDLFESAQWRILPDSPAYRMARAVADALADTLPCYTVGPRAAFDASCNGAFALIETIQIEGHTDNVPVSELRLGTECMRDNLALSACRGAETLRSADRYRPELAQFLNLRGDPVLSFAGYGDRRPIDEEDTGEARAANRRIDLRFILQTPRNMREVEEIRERLTRTRPHLPAVDDRTPP